MKTPIITIKGTSKVLDSSIYIWLGLKSLISKGQLVIVQMGVEIYRWFKRDLDRFILDDREEPTFLSRMGSLGLMKVEFRRVWMISTFWRLKRGGTKVLHIFSPCIPTLVRGR